MIGLYNKGELEDKLAFVTSQTPPRSIASIHRQVSAIAQERGWKAPSYDRVRRIIKNLDSALVTLAQ